MNTKIKRIISFITFIVLIFTSVIFASESPNNYYSLHKENLTVSYQSTDYDQNGDPITKQQVFTGYHDINDLSNSKIVCKSETPCSSSDDLIWLPSIQLGDPAAGSFAPVSKTERFKVFIPPGAVQINVHIYCESLALLKTAVRAGTPPETTTTDLSMFSAETSYSFQTLIDQDIYLQNAGGRINVFSGALRPPPDYLSPNPPLTDGKWIYIYNYTQASSIGTVQFAVQVDKTAYQNWYYTYDWTNDPEGLNGGTVVTPTNSLSLTLQADKQSGNYPLDVTFTPTIGSNGTPPYTYAWDFGDGETSLDIPDANGNVTHTYTSADTYKASVTVEDENAQTTTDSVSITVTAPVFSVSLATSPSVGVVTEVLTGGYSLDVIPTVTNGTDPFIYEFDSGAGNGDYVLVTLSSGKINHIYQSAGNFTARIKVTDANGAEATDQIVINAVSKEDDTFAKGKQYCIDNPVDCGVMSIDSQLQIKLNSFKYNAIKYNLIFDLSPGTLNWILDPNSIVPVQ